MAEPLRSNPGAGDKGNEDRQRQLNTLIGLSEKSVLQTLKEMGLNLMPIHLIFERS
jgi:hypothetical protein